MPLDIGGLEKYQSLLPQQKKLYDKLEQNNLKSALNEPNPKSFAEALSFTQDTLKREYEGTEEGQLNEDQKEWRRLARSPEDLKAVLEALDYFEDLEEAEKQKIQDFYEGERFKELYEEIKQEKKAKGDFIKVRSEEIGEKLKNGTAKDKQIYDLLTNPKYKMLSMMCWQKSEIKRNTEAESKEQELKAIDEFFESLDQLKPEEQKDTAALLQAFAKKHPQYAEQVKSDWYQKKFKEKLEAKEDPDLDKLQKFYNSEEFKKIYNKVSAAIGKAPEWSDIRAELEKQGKTDILNLADRHKDKSTKMWNEVWERARDDFDRFENEQLQKFSESKKNPKDWEDIEALAEEFQKTRKRFAGDPRLKYYKDQLTEKKSIKERYWKFELSNFYASTLPSIYEQIPNSDKDYVRFKDVVTHLKATGKEDIAQILEAFPSESKEQWDKFWTNKEKDFNTQENQAIEALFKALTPQQLDNPDQIAAQYEQDQRFKANAWFKERLTARLDLEKTKFETEYQQLTSSLPDAAIATAMLASFKQAKNFTQRADWLKQAEHQVPRYRQIIEQNNTLEARLNEQLIDYPDLKAEFGKIKAAYAEGKTNYGENFYSPRKHSDALQALSGKLTEREKLVQDTLTRAENKRFSDMPKLSDNKKLSYEEFRDKLKGLNFYELDPKVRKNEKVRAALRTKTKALHQQWLDHRTLWIEQNTRTQVEKSKSVIRGVKLPKALPDNLKNLKDFTLALKDAEVYAALPPKMMKNEDVRQAARDHNQKLWAQYQAQQAKKNTEPQLDPTSPEAIENVHLTAAKKTITGVKLTDRLQTQLDEKLKDKDPNNKDAFTIALREIGIYQGVDKDLWQNPELREAAWQQNMKLQAQYLGKSEAQNTPLEAETNQEHGLPGHYKLDWKGLENRLNPEQKARGTERFKQLHNRSDIGLQTLMQHFHGQVGTFVLETLSVMSQDRFDKAVTALRNVRIEAGKRDQASEWLRVLCQTAGTDYLQKEASSSWAHFRQHFSQTFGQSLDKAWETEDENKETTVAEVIDTTSLETDEEDTLLTETSGEDALALDEEADPEAAIEDGPEAVVEEEAPEEEGPETLDQTEANLAEPPAENTDETLEEALDDEPEGIDQAPDEESELADKSPEAETEDQALDTEVEAEGLETETETEESAETDPDDVLEPQIDSVIDDDQALPTEADQTALDQIEPLDDELNIEAGTEAAALDTAEPVDDPAAALDAETMLDETTDPLDEAMQDDETPPETELEADTDDLSQDDPKTLDNTLEITDDAADEETLDQTLDSEAQPAATVEAATDDNLDEAAPELEPSLAEDPLEASVDKLEDEDEALSEPEAEADTEPESLDPLDQASGLEAQTEVEATIEESPEAVVGEEVEEEALGEGVAEASDKTLEEDPDDEAALAEEPLDQDADTTDDSPDEEALNQALDSEAQPAATVEAATDDNLDEAAPELEPSLAEDPLEASVDKLEDEEKTEIDSVIDNDQALPTEADQTALDQIEPLDDELNIEAGTEAAALGTAEPVDDPAAALDAETMLDETTDPLDEAMQDDETPPETELEADTDDLSQDDPKTLDNTLEIKETPDKKVVKAPDTADQAEALTDKTDLAPESENDDEALLKAVEPETKVAVEDDDFESDLEVKDLPEETPIEVVEPVVLEPVEDPKDSEAFEAKTTALLNTLPIKVDIAQERLKAELGFSETLGEGLDEDHQWLIKLARRENAQALDQNIKEHQRTQPRKHPFVAQYQERHLASSMTVLKFLQELQSYCQYSAGIKASIKHKNTGLQLEGPQAEALFNAFATKFHAAKDITQLQLGFEDNVLLVKAHTQNKTDWWPFRVAQ